MDFILLLIYIPAFFAAVPFLSPRINDAVWGIFFLSWTPWTRFSCKCVDSLFCERRSANGLHSRDLMEDRGLCMHVRGQKEV